jgi:hypothetical protein
MNKCSIVGQRAKPFVFTSNYRAAWVPFFPSKCTKKFLTSSIDTSAASSSECDFLKHSVSCSCKQLNYNSIRKKDGASMNYKSLTFSVPMPSIYLWNLFPSNFFVQPDSHDLYKPTVFAECKF